MHYAESLIPAPDVQRMLAEYQAIARHPDLKPFEISGLLPVEDFERRGDARPGVYLFYRDDHTLIYVGKSSGSVEARIAAHLSPNEKGSKFWTQHPAAFIQTVSFSHAWEAGSLEEFLEDRAKAYRP